jgi:hypothetical protein
VIKILLQKIEPPSCLLTRRGLTVQAKRSSLSTL